MILILLVACFSSNSAQIHDQDNREAYNSYMTARREKLYEGDMILDKDQYEIASRMDLRREINQMGYLWNNATMRFVISDNLIPIRAKILKAMKLWETNTCVKFLEVQQGDRQPHVIFKKLDGCWSRVGMQNSRDGQEISIGRGCAHVGIIAHEIGHVLGFWHEHAREDRDNTVKVLTKNIEEGEEVQFTVRKNVNEYGTPYDLESIMHYGPKLFTKNGKNTIVPKDPMKNFIIGQRSTLSFIDIKQMNLMYRCSEKCKIKRNCRNPGFLTKECVCHCPKGFIGAACEMEVTVDEPKCGGKFTSEGMIVSPNYPEKYSKGSQCVWVFKAPKWKKIQMQFLKFDLYRRSETRKTCWSDSVEIRDAWEYEGKMYCGHELEGRTLTQTNEVTILFTASKNENNGFKAFVTFV